MGGWNFRRPSGEFGFLYKYYTGTYRPGRVCNPGYEFCPDRGEEVHFSECLECDKFRVWHEMDGDFRRCWYEFKKLEKEGRYEPPEKQQKRKAPEEFDWLQEDFNRAAGEEEVKPLPLSCSKYADLGGGDPEEGESEDSCESGDETGEEDGEDLNRKLPTHEELLQEMSDPWDVCEDEWDEEEDYEEEEEDEDDVFDIFEWLD